MIEVRIAGRPRHFAARLADRARAIAQARAENALLARRGDAARWRRAKLLWPLFTWER